MSRIRCPRRGEKIKKLMASAAAGRYETQRFALKGSGRTAARMVSCWRFWGMCDNVGKGVVHSPDVVNKCFLESNAFQLDYQRRLEI